MSPREALCTLQNDLFVREQTLLRKEKDDYEKGKFLQLITKEHIMSESLPHLEINASSNNIVQWVSRIYSKFQQVQKDSPQLMLNHIFTVKQLAGPLKIYVDTKETLEEIFSCLVTKYIRGSAGLMQLYNLKTLRESYALDTGTSIRNIDDFIRTTGVF